MTSRISGTVIAVRSYGIRAHLECFGDAVLPVDFFGDKEVRFGTDFELEFTEESEVPKITFPSPRQQTQEERDQWDELIDSFAS